MNAHTLFWKRREHQRICRWFFEELHSHFDVVMFTVRLDAPLDERIRRKRYRKFEGYIEPKMYFNPIYDDTRDVVVATNVVIHTTKIPLECAGAIMDRLPDTMI